jgi:hypothetical protein
LTRVVFHRNCWNYYVTVEDMKRLIAGVSQTPNSCIIELDLKVLGVCNSVTANLRAKKEMEKC